MSNDKLQLHSNNVRDFIVDKQQELASTSLLHLSGNNPSEEDFSKLIWSLTGLLSDKAIVTVVSHEKNKEVIAELYRTCGVPFHTFVVSQKNSSQTVLLFSKTPPNMSRKKVAPWGMGLLKDFVAAQNVKKSKTVTKELNNVIAVLNQMNHEVNWFSTKVNADKEVVIHSSLAKMKVPVPHVLKIHEKESKIDHKTLEGMAKPEGLTDEDKEINVHTSVFEYIIENFTPANGKLVDLNAITGDFAQAVHKLVNAGRKNSVVVHTHDNETLAYERLEALSNGAWKNWTYHEPEEKVFTIVNSQNS